VPRLKAKQLRELSEEERRQRLSELLTELRSLKMRSSSASIESPGRLREVKRAIARVLTVEREVERGGKREAQPQGRR